MKKLYTVEDKDGAVVATPFETVREAIHWIWLQNAKAAWLRARKFRVITNN